jgi:nitrogen-specific signal transduction histidine kinase
MTPFDNFSIPKIPTKHEHRLFGLVLISLHLTLWNPFVDWVSQALLLAHFGLFLLWQPLPDRNEPLKKYSMLLSAVMIIIFVVTLNHWLIVLWKVMLLGLAGGQDASRPRDRVINLSALIFLTLDLFIIDSNHLFPLGLLTEASSVGLYYGLLLIPFSFLLVESEERVGRQGQMDFFHGLTLALLVILIGLGSLVHMEYSNLSYPMALFRTALIVAIFILGISWLWVLFGGFDALDQVWARNLLSVSNSFEHWLATLTQPGNYKHMTPEQFLTSGFKQLINLPWIAGIRWESPYGEGSMGQESRYQVVFNPQSLKVSVHTAQRMSGTHYAHVKLLIQLLEYFHQAKRREEELAHQAHLQAVHETGAKLTHDIKNLIQSLHNITAAIEIVEPSSFGETQRLLQNQIPLLSQRLKLTLDKLQKPEQTSYKSAPIRHWWKNLNARYHKRNIHFVENILWNSEIPEDLFDNIAENLLENALNKRNREPQINIYVTLNSSENKVSLQVCDDGSAIPANIERILLERSVPSRDGFGIGLYHAAKQTLHTGYRLKLTHNEPQHVCFVLRSIEPND